MRYALSTLTALAWALWLGGAVTLFLLVTHLFSTHYAVAREAAPRMFVYFARYQLFLAAAALVASAVWRLSERRRVLTLLFSLFAFCAVPTILIAAIVTPRMEELRVRGESQTPAYRQLHRRASVLYVTETALLLAAGVLMPRAIRPAS